MWQYFYLKWFLTKISLNQEKGELIDLILQTFSPQTIHSNSGEYIRRFDNYVNTDRTESTDIQSQSPTISPTARPSNQSENISATNVSNIRINSDSTSGRPQTEDELKDSKEDKSNIYFNVDDIENIQQLKDLSVKQLKLILTRNFIDYKGCVEKEELLSKAERLWNDRHLNKSQSIKSSLICIF